MRSPTKPEVEERRKVREKTGSVTKVSHRLPFLALGDDPSLCLFFSSTFLVWFLLFNGISTFVGYLMPKLFSENSSGTI